MTPTIGLLLRSLFWTLALPGIVAGLVPWRYLGLRSAAINWADPLDWAGLVAVAAGVGLLIASILEFARSGGGTLSPVDPPRALVVQGLYRYVRNPMYLSVSLILLGEAALAGSGDLIRYWIVWFLAANLFVLGYEEPRLRRRFGAEYERYAGAVGRWIPRFHPWRGEGS